MHTLFGTGYTHGASKVKATSYVLCTSVYIYRECQSIHVNVKNSTAEGTCIQKKRIEKGNMYCDHNIHDHGRRLQFIAILI